MSLAVKLSSLLEWWPWVRRPRCPLTVTEIMHLDQLIVWVNLMPTSGTLSREEALFLTDCFNRVAEQVPWERCVAAEEPT